MMGSLNMEGLFKIEHWRAGKLLSTYNFKNKITSKAKEYVLDLALTDDTAQRTPWYCGLFTSSFTNFSYDTHPPVISNEFTTYDEAARPEVSFEAATTAGGYSYVESSIDPYMVFTVSTGVTSTALNGIFVCDAATGAPTYLWSTAAFGNNNSSPAPITVVAADVLRVQYTVRIAT